ncbi:photosystem II reaction center W protein, chloroplastic-like [Primulina huaijiensis]|uniref:photosystem II reaction center W protein, chloroplastic-like n=1 Tax=Primulina huaijiensis TaxID=1492673 RepID=UPI003CC76735
MAAISTFASTSPIARAAPAQRRFAVRPSAIIGLPSMSNINTGKVRCTMEGERGTEESESKLGVAASSFMASACAAAMSSPAALALVDERLSTEGTGLPFGLSNNLLVWILAGVFALIWALYFVYTTSLDEDEESGLSL